MKYPFFLFVLPLLSACQVATKYPLIDVEIPCEWHSEMPIELCPKEGSSYVWWDALNDPILSSLLQRAADQNLDLSLATSRILEARALYLGKTAPLYPHLDGSVRAGHLFSNRDSLVNGLLNAAMHKNPKTSRNRYLNFFEAGFDAEWELDLFGMTAHEMRAAQASVEASEEDFYHIWVSLSAEIARNYIELRESQQKQAIQQEMIEAQKQIVFLIESLYFAGFVDTITWEDAKANLNLLLAEQPALDLAIYRTIHRLSVLLGHSPGALAEELSDDINLPHLPQEIPLCFPSELLRNRPDIRKAERELASATEQVEAAVAALFPRLSMRGFIGNIASSIDSLLTGRPTTWGIGPCLLAPIFNSKMLKQNVDYNKIKTQQALYQYQKTVLTALEEAENAIAIFNSEWEQAKILSDVYFSQKINHSQIQTLFERGLKNQTDVLKSQLTILKQKKIYLENQTRLLTSYIALSKALGKNS